MADYKAIKGFKIRSVSSAPTTDIGQLWYNTTSNTLQFDGVGAGVWASGTSTPTGNQTGAGLGNTPAAAVVALGQGPTLAKTNNSITWNGSSWVEGNNTNHLRSGTCAFGLTTAGMAMGGGGPTGPGQSEVEDYNGTCWTEIVDLAEGYQGMNACGTTSAGMVASGEPPSTKDTQIWNGTSWTETNNLNTLHEYGAISFAGSTTSTVVASGGPDLTHPSGGPTTYTPNTEEWNGTSWTEKANISIGRHYMGGTGTASTAMCFGGITKSPTNVYVLSGLVEQFDGSTWTEIGDMGTARQMFARSHGTSTSALALAGGTQPSPHTVSAVVEDWDGAPAGVQTVTVS